MNNNTNKTKIKVCSIKKCENKHYARSYCNKHYARWRKHGDPQIASKAREEKRCSVEGCNKKHSGLGYCMMHYERFKKYGDPHMVKLKMARGRPETCSIDGCDKKHEAKGYCQMHYIRLQKHGDPLYVKERKACKVDSCDKLSRNWGYCSTHASRFYIHGDPSKTLLNTENNGKCSVEGCKDKYFGSNLCNRHYKKERYKRVSKTQKGRLQRQTDYERRRARKNKAPFNDFTGEDWLECLKAFCNMCAYCGWSGEIELERDHVVPLSVGGSHTKTNIVPCCVSCNRRKWVKSLEEWYPEQPSYSREREEKILKWTGYKKVSENKIQMQLF